MRPAPAFPLTILLATLLLAASLPLTGAADPDAGDTPPLDPFYERESLAFHHIRYHQMVDGLRVLDAGASEHVAKAGTGLAIRHDATVPAEPRSGTFRLTERDAVRAASAALDVARLAPGAAPESERVWTQTPAGLRKAYAVTLAATDPAGEWRIAVDAETGAILQTVNLALFAEAPGRVFRDNPIVALQDPGLTDNRLSIDAGAFTGAYVDVTVRNLSADPVEGFANPRVRIADALVNPATDKTLVFPREDPRFLEVMAYHYIEEALARMETLGYGDLIDYQIQVEAHAPSAFRSGVVLYPSLYPDAYAGNGRLTFFYRSPNPGGPGFGSPAEDAEIVVHELGHLLHFAAAPEVSGDWRGIWGEGTADFLSAVLLEDVTQGYGDPCWSEWLAHYYPEDFRFPYEDLPCLRVLKNNLTMPDDFFGDTSYQWAHENGQFWSGALWTIREAIGANESLVLVTEALHLTPPKPKSFEDLGTTILLADAGLTGGARETLIRDAFAEKGILIPTLQELKEAGRVDAALIPSETPADPGATSAPTRGIPQGAPLALLALLAGAALARRASR